MYALLTSLKTFGVLCSTSFTFVLPFHCIATVSVQLLRYGLQETCSLGGWVAGWVGLSVI